MEPDVPMGPSHDEVAGGVADEPGVAVAPPMDSTGVGVAIGEGVGTGEAASPSTTPLTLTIALESSEGEGDGVAASAGTTTGAGRSELAEAPVSAPISTTARPSTSNRTENLRTGTTPSGSGSVNRNAVGNSSSHNRFGPWGGPLDAPIEQSLAARSS